MRGGGERGRMKESRRGREVCWWIRGLGEGGRWNVVILYVCGFFIGLDHHPPQKLTSSLVAVLSWLSVDVSLPRHSNRM